MFKCPNGECDSRSFKISGCSEVYGTDAWVNNDEDVLDTDQYDGSTEWDNDHDMECCECGHTATVRDFKEAAGETVEPDDAIAFDEREPNEAELLKRAIEVLRSVREDLAADGCVSEQTEHEINAILLSA